MGDFNALIASFGSIIGIIGSLFGFVVVIRNNAKWSAIVDQKIGTMLEGINDLKTRLARVEDDKADLRLQVRELQAKYETQERSLTRMHNRLDILMGGRDRGHDE